MSLDASDFDYVCSLVRQQSGMALEPGKEYLVETRLSPVAKRAGCDSVTALITRLRRRGIDDLRREVVEALTTNETQFFRDVHPFDALRNEILPELIDKRRALRRLNFWCAAASTGQEPYSLMMLLAESFPSLAGWAVQCIASDLSDEVLARARHGCYGHLEINRGLPERLLDKYFCKQGKQWQIAEEMRRSVDFRNINLVLDWPPMPQMDLILMRNVLIYFDVETKQAILKKIRSVLKPDGYLFLGTAETTLNLDPQFEQVQVDRTVCYQLRS